MAYDEYGGDEWNWWDQEEYQPNPPEPETGGEPDPEATVDIGNDYEGIPYEPPREDPKPEQQYQEPAIAQGSASQTSNDSSGSSDDNRGSESSSSGWDPAAWLRSQGIAESIISQEAGNLGRYGSAEAVMRTNPGTLDAYRTRGDRPTLSNFGIGGDLDLNSDGKLDPGWERVPIGGLGPTGEDSTAGNPQFRWLGLGGAPPPGGRTTPTPGARPGGSGPTGASGVPSVEQILRELGILGQQYGGPGSQGVFGENGPLQQVGQDPLSQLITGGYANLIGAEGRTSLGDDIDATLRGLIERGGAIDEDPQDKAARMEAKRQPIEAFRRMQTNQMRGELANRNLASEPGMPQGSEIGALGRFEEQIAPYYATAGQNIASEDSQANNERLSQALTLATGLSQAQSQTFLSTLESATDRQRVLSQIALETLDKNMTWNMFLAQLGLQRGQVMNQLQQGQLDSLYPLLVLFSQYVNMSRQGYV